MIKMQGLIIFRIPSPIYWGGGELFLEIYKETFFFVIVLLTHKSIDDFPLKITDFP